MASMGGGRVAMELHGFTELQILLLNLSDKVQEKIVKPALRKMEKRLHGRVVQSFSGMPIGVVTSSILTAIAGARIRLQRKGGRRNSGMIRYTFDLPADREDAIAINVLEYGGTDRFGNRRRAIAPIRNAVDRHQSSDLAQVKMEIKKGIVRLARKEAKRLGLSPKEAARGVKRTSEAFRQAGIRAPRVSINP